MTLVPIPPLKLTQRLALGAGISRHVSPNTTRQHMLDAAAAQAEIASELNYAGATFSAAAKFAYEVGGQFCVMILLASPQRLWMLTRTSAISGCQPTLSHRVRHIIGGRTEKEMVGPYARRVVATVKHPEAIRNASVDKLPCGAMRANRLTPNAEHPIAARIAPAHPQPASRAFSNSRPKSLRNGLWCHLISRLNCEAPATWNDLKMIRPDAGVQFTTVNYFNHSRQRLRLGHSGEQERKPRRRDNRATIAGAA